jgi:hypothetical protein
LCLCGAYRAYYFIRKIGISGSNFLNAVRICQKCIRKLRSNFILISSSAIFSALLFALSEYLTFLSFEDILSVEESEAFTGCIDEISLKVRAKGSISILTTFLLIVFLLVTS